MSLSDIDFERVTHFPVKLWDVVNDDSSDIFRWSDDGQSFFVDDQKYEQQIMDKFPGFVQIASFANLRRLLREYSFSWQNNDCGEFQFSHPGFKQGEKEQILSIRTKRKVTQAANGHPIKIRRRTTSDGKLKTASKAWMQPSAKGNVNLRDETLLRFPEKFWAVVNDSNDLLYWGEDGDTVIVNDRKYEEEIMVRYPGFVQINSFANLRRLLREYGFSWSIRENGFFEFSHSHMKRDRSELLKGVKTKRKAMKAGAHHPYLSYFKVEPAYPSPPAQSNKICRDPSELFEKCTSPEVSQAVDYTLHHGLHINPKMTNHASGDHHHHYHHSMPYNAMPYPPYHRLMPYRAPWPCHAASAENAEPFFYTTYENHASTCGNHHGFGDGPHLSPNIAHNSRSDVRASTADSKESIYASTSTCKGSPTLSASHQTVNEESPTMSPATTFRSQENPTVHCGPYQSSGNAVEVNDFQQGSGYYESGIYQSVFHPHYQPNGDDTDCEEKPVIQSSMSLSEGPERLEINNSEIKSENQCNEEQEAVFVKLLEENTEDFVAHPQLQEHVDSEEEGDTICGANTNNSEDKYGK